MTRKGLISGDKVDFDHLSNELLIEVESDSPFIYCICSALLLMLCMLLYSGYVWRTKTHRAILLRYNQSVEEWKLCKGTYIVSIVTPIFSGFGIERLAMLKVKLFGSEGMYTACILNPPNKLFAAGTTQLLVLASPENIGVINGIAFGITTSNTMKKSYKWKISAIEVLNYQRNERYIMKKKSLSFRLKAGTNSTSSYVDLDKKNKHLYARSFNVAIQELITHHTWTLTKYHHGTFLFHDNILLIFLVISLIMSCNYLMHLLVPLEKVEGKALTNLGPKLPVYLFIDFLVFFIAVIFEQLLRNVNVKDRNLQTITKHFSTGHPIEEYEHFCVEDKFLEYLHQVFCNLGIHQCESRKDTNNGLDIDDIRIERLKEVVREEDMTESLIAHLWPDCEHYNECYLCTFNEHLYEVEQHNRLVFRKEIAPIVNLNEHAFSILKLGCGCLDDFNDDHNVFPSLLTDTHKDKTIKKFINDVFLLLHLCQEFYLSYTKEINVSSIFNVYKVLAYELLHYYIHILLRSNISELKLNIGEVINRANSVQIDIPPAKYKFFNMIYRRVDSPLFQSSKQHPSGSKDISERNKILNQRLYLFDQLDNALDIIINAVVYIVYQQHARENEFLTDSMMHEIFSYASNVLDTYIYFESSDTELINKIDTNISQHKFENISTIVQEETSQNPNFHELLLYLERIVFDRDAMIENAIDTIENNIIDSFVSDELVCYLQEQSISEDLDETEIKMLCKKVIEESEEEVHQENIIPMFIFARLTIFWGIAVYVRENKYLLGTNLSGQNLLSNILHIARNNIHRYTQLKTCLLEAGICEYCSRNFELNSKWYSHYMKLFSRQFLTKKMIFNLLFQFEHKLKAVVLDCVDDIIIHTFEMQTPLVAIYYASAVIDHESCVVVSFIKSIVEDQFGSLDKNPSFEENPDKEKSDELNTSEVVDDQGTTPGREKEVFFPSFMDVMEKRLDLQPGELSMFFQSTYHYFEVGTGLLDFHFNYEAVFFKDNHKFFPYRVKRYIQLVMFILIITGFVVLILRNSDLQGPTVREWSLLTSIGIILNVFLFEPIKVVLIVIFEIYFSKRKK